MVKSGMVVLTERENDDVSVNWILSTATVTLVVERERES
jgi:hypothetical protein